MVCIGKDDGTHFENCSVRWAACSRGSIRSSRYAMSASIRRSTCMTRARATCCPRSCPGIAPEDVELSITGETLTMRGERKRPEGVKDDSYRRQERPVGRWSRTITLPDRVDSAQVCGLVHQRHPDGQPPQGRERQAPPHHRDRGQLNSTRTASFQ